MSKITIIDSIMGSGKTSWAIQNMLEDKENNYIYITPYLSEVQRIKESCPERRFAEPKNMGNGKLDSLHGLVLSNRNIASTHSLFKMSTSTTMSLIKSNDYILILDEVMDVVEQIPLKKDDLPSLLTLKLITIHPNGTVIWNDYNYEGEYDYIKVMCKNNSVFMVNGCLLMWTFPVEVFNSFKEVYVMTYMFKGQIQRYYYDLYNLEYEYKSVEKVSDKYSLCQYRVKDDVSGILKLMSILENDKINAIGDDEYALSKSWYVKSDKNLIKQLKNNIGNYYKRKIKAKSKDNMWSTFKDYKGTLSGEGYTKGFVSVGCRATNEYIDKSNLVYTVNNFLNPIVKHFFNQHDVDVDEDTFALSELIQWIWRSRIRNGESINLYIPSNRMRNLLTNWLQ